MCAISAIELLNAWEAGQVLSPVQRALALLMAALPDESPQALAELSIGQRDERLLSLREQLFGSRIVAVASCPCCAERLEMSFDAAEISTMQNSVKGMFDVNADGYTVRARPVNSFDLMSAMSTSDALQAQSALLVSCVIEARRGKAKVKPTELPDAVAIAIAQRMSEADPQAEVQMAMRCPNCGHEWQALFDVAAFLWREIDAWANRTLGEVHVLASAYGWSEADILAMSASRRQRYLQMVG